MITNAIEALTPLIQVLNLAQKDGTSWCQLYHAVMDAFLKVKQSGRDSIVSAVEKRLDLLLNPLVHLFLFLDKKIRMPKNEINIIVKWFEALKIPEFKRFLFSFEMNNNVEISRKLQFFMKYCAEGIAVSEASVERCFSVHRRIHSPMRASLDSSIVEDILFIRYNHSLSLEKKSI